MCLQRFNQRNLRDKEGDFKDQISFLRQKSHIVFYCHGLCWSLIRYVLLDLLSSHTTFN